MQFRLRLLGQVVGATDDLRVSCQRVDGHIDGLVDALGNALLAGRESKEGKSASVSLSAAWPGHILIQVLEVGHVDFPNGAEHVRSFRGHYCSRRSHPQVV